MSLQTFRLIGCDEALLDISGLALSCVSLQEFNNLIVNLPIIIVGYIGVGIVCQTTASEPLYSLLMLIVGYIITFVVVAVCH